MIIGKFENQANGRITGKFEALLVGCIPLTFEPNSKGADYTAPKPAVKLARPGRRPARKVARPSFPFGSIHRSCRCRLTPRCSPPRRPGVTFWFGIGQSAKRNNRRWTSGAALCHSSEPSFADTISVRCLTIWSKTLVRLRRSLLLFSLRSMSWLLSYWGLSML